MLHFATVFFTVHHKANVHVRPLIAFLLRVKKIDPSNKVIGDCLSGKSVLCVSGKVQDLWLFVCRVYADCCHAFIFARPWNQMKGSAQQLCSNTTYSKHSSYLSIYTPCKTVEVVKTEKRVWGENIKTSSCIFSPHFQVLNNALRLIKRWKPWQL